MAPRPSQLSPSDRQLPAAPRLPAGTVLLLALSSDCPSLRQQLAQAMPDYRLIEADRLEQALALWHTNTITWVVIDLAWAGGLDFLTVLTQHHPQRPLPAVVLVDPGQERTALEAMKLGAADYLFKADLSTTTLATCLATPFPGSAPAPLGNPQPTEQLRHELALLETTLESILTGYWEIDFVANTAYMSPGLKRLFGYADHELPNTPDIWQTLILPEDLPLALDNLAGHLESRGQVPYYNEVRYRHKTGAILWILCTGRVIAWDKADQPLRMVGCHVDITHLKQAEAQLQKHRAHLQDAQRIGNLGSWELDLETQQITWSDQVYYIFGRNPALGPPTIATVNQQIHPEDLAEYQRVVDRAIQTGQAYDREFRILRPDGTLVYIQGKGERVIDGLGRATHLTGTVQDISDRKRDEAKRQRTEAELQKLSLRLSLALQSARIGTWERDLNTDEISWDQCLIDLYGFPSPGSNGQSPRYPDWQARVYTEDWPRVAAAEQALIDHDAPYDLEFRIWRSDGSLAWIRSSALVQRDPQGRPQSVIGINYDITEPKRAADELRDLSLRLSLALDSGGFGSWEWHLDSDVILWDRRLIDLYGFAPDLAPTYQAWRSRVHSDDLPATEAALQRTIQTGVPYNIEFRIYREEQGVSALRWVKSSALVRRNAQGKPLSLIGINYDISEAKQAEIELLRTTAQLEASNRELEAFAYSVSHDLRAPLRAIDGFSYALLEDYGDQLGQEGQDYFDRIRYNVGRMGQLIDDLLRLSRVSRSAMNYQEVDLSDLVQQELDDLQAQTPDRRVSVDIVSHLSVAADPTLMRMVIANLVQNAWKFTSHRPVTEIAFGMTPETGVPVYYLRDNGAGFDMAYADKLFGVFQRLHNADEFPGTGIGLATVQRILHRHGGRVWAQGAIDQGATFFFTLPPGPAGLGEAP
jgi:PAS domain S-box-containing protein